MRSDNYSQKIGDCIPPSFLKTVYKLRKSIKFSKQKYFKQK